MSWPVGDRLLRIIDVVFGSSINAAAVAAGIETSTLFRLVEGAVSDPRMDTVRRVADAFGVPVGWLLGEVDASQAQQRDDPLPEWLWLLDAYSCLREQKIRAWLNGAAATRSEAQSLLAGLRDFKLLPAARHSPMAVVEQLLTQHGAAADLEIRAIRNLYAAQLEILELGVIKLSQLGVTPKPPGPASARGRRAKKRR